MRNGGFFLIVGLVLLACGDNAGGKAGTTGDGGMGDLDARPNTDLDPSPSDAGPRFDSGRPDAGWEDGSPPADDAAQPRPDRDGDAVADEIDNCPDLVNPEQVDQDGDHAGDACDPQPQQFGHRLGGQALALALEVVMRNA